MACECCDNRGAKTVVIYGEHKVKLCAECKILCNSTIVL